MTSPTPPQSRLALSVRLQPKLPAPERTELHAELPTLVLDVCSCSQLISQEGC